MNGEGEMKQKKTKTKKHLRVSNGKILWGEDVQESQSSFKHWSDCLCDLCVPLI